MHLSRETLAEYLDLRALWRRDPVLYVRQRLGLNPTWQQQKLLEALAPDGAKVSVRSGHGIGKTGAVAGGMLWHIECFDFAKNPCTAPTQSQLQQILWSELAKWFRRSDALSQALQLPKALWLSALFELTATRLHDRNAPHEWFAIARTSRREQPDALQGFHASDVRVSADGRSIVEREEDGGALLFVIEEASGVPDGIFEVAEGALSSHGARLLMVGNPTRNTGFFADSHKKNRASYTTLHFSSRDSPLVDESYRPNLVRKYGEGSNVVRVRADGEFPKQDDDVLIPIELVEAALEREPSEEPQGERRLGIDPARYGKNRTTYVLRQGNRIEHIAVHAKESTMKTAGRAQVYQKAWNADWIFVDVVGLGAGVFDRIEEDPHLKSIVVAVNAAGKAPTLPKKEIEAQPHRLRDYLWMEMKRWLEREAPVLASAEPEDELFRTYTQELTAELTTPTYTINSSGHLVVESKEQMMARNIESPDLADGLGVTFAPRSIQRSAASGLATVPHPGRPGA